MKNAKYVDKNNTKKLFFEAKKSGEFFLYISPLMITSVQFSRSCDR